MTEHTPEKVADLIAEVRGWLNDHRHFHSARRSHVRLLADALEAVSENGLCWDDGPVMHTPGECQSMPPKCELRAGHLGAHQGGTATWMRNPSSYNQVARERDEALAVIEGELSRHTEKHGETARYEPGDYYRELPPTHWESYVICNACGTDYPCKTRQNLSRIPERPKED